MRYYRMPTFLMGPSRYEPITERITFNIDAVSDNADKSELQYLLKMAVERCPVMSSMSHRINVEATIN